VSPLGERLRGVDAEIVEAQICSGERASPSSTFTFRSAGFSLVTVLKNGRMLEVATIGREGMVGITAVLGNPVSATFMVQAEAHSCYRMKVDVFRREMDRRSVFSALLTHYAQGLVGFIVQSTACNAVHSVEQRLARWLFMARDRMESDAFPLTQEFVAMVLGASRPTVTIVASTGGGAHHLPPRPSHDRGP